MRPFPLDTVAAENPPRLIIRCPSPECSLQAGVALGDRLERGDVVALWGDLGAGKTLFTRGVARGLGVPESIPVTSPTFTLINEYEGRLPLYHLDLYRLSDLDELETLPWRDVLFGRGAALVEWPDRMGEELPEERWDIRITITGDESRILVVEPHGEARLRRLEKWLCDLPVESF